MGIVGSLDFGQPLDLKTKTILTRGHCAQEIGGPMEQGLLTYALHHGDH